MPEINQKLKSGRETEGSAEGREEKKTGKSPACKTDGFKRERQSGISLSTRDTEVGRESMLTRNYNQ